MQFRRDLVSHSIVSAAIVIVGSRINLGFGIALSLAFIFGKEIWDSMQKGNFFDWKDVLAGILGLGFGILLA